MKKLKIGYFADGPWSHLAFKKLISDNDIEIAFIVPRNDTTDNTLLGLARQYKIDYISPVNINSEEFFQKAKAYNCDLFVSMSFNQIFRKRIIELPYLKTINCHAGKLPFYRGRNILNWVLINDEKEFGITVHYVDEGIDTGDIISQKTFQINDFDDYNSLLNIAFKECSILLYDTIKQIQKNDITRISQKSIHPVGFYCGKRGEGDEIINWNSNSRELFNFIRAICYPGPIATTFIDGVLVKINRARYISNAPNYIGKNGQLISKTDNGFIVKTNDSFIEIFEITTKAKLQVGKTLTGNE